MLHEWNPGPPHLDEPACWSWPVPPLESADERVAAMLAEILAADPGVKQELLVPALHQQARLVGSEMARFGCFHDGRCAICDAASRSLVKDHCHETGQERGWLCRSCNVMEGKSGESIFEAYRLWHPAAILGYYDMYDDGLWWIRGWPVMRYRASARTRGKRPFTPWGPPPL